MGAPRWWTPTHPHIGPPGSIAYLASATPKTPTVRPSGAFSTPFLGYTVCTTSYITYKPYTAVFARDDGGGGEEEVGGGWTSSDHRSHCSPKCRTLCHANGTCTHRPSNGPTVFVHNAMSERPRRAVCEMVHMDNFEPNRVHVRHHIHKSALARSHTLFYANRVRVSGERVCVCVCVFAHASRRGSPSAVASRPAPTHPTPPPPPSTPTPHSFVTCAAHTCGHDSFNLYTHTHTCERSTNAGGVCPVCSGCSPFLLSRPERACTCMTNYIVHIWIWCVLVYRVLYNLYACVLNYTYIKYIGGDMSLGPCTHDGDQHCACVCSCGYTHHTDTHA